MRKLPILFLLFTLSCSIFNRKQDSTLNDISQNEGQASVQSTEQKLDQRIYTLESKLLKIQEKLDAMSAGSIAAQKTMAPTQNGIDPSTTTARGKIMNVTHTENEEVLLYKEAKILFDSNRIHEAQLAFTKFLNQNKDHPLSPSAQFHLGLCSLELKEWSTAQETYEVLLTKYPYSSHTSDALKNLIFIEQKMNNPKQSLEYEQTLLTLFPQSPAARMILEEKTKTGIKPQEITPIQKDGA